MKDKRDLINCSKERLNGIIRSSCPSEYGLEDVEGCNGGGKFSCDICWKSAMDKEEMENEGK